MIRISAIFLFLFFNLFSSYGQKSVTLYFKKNWMKTFDRKEAEYYRIINYDSSNKPTGLVRDYYMNGKVQYEATKLYVDTIDPHRDSTNGVARWYSKKGQLVTESNYVNSKLQGEKKTWYENGVIKSIAHYDKGALDGEYATFYENGNYKIKGNYKQGVIIDKKREFFSMGFVKYDNFYDNFQATGNPYDWKMPVGEGLKCYIMQDTGMFIYNNSQQDAIAIVDIPLNAKSYFSFRIGIKKDSGKPEAGYGMVFDYKDDNNFSYFMIRSDGKFRIGNKADGREIIQTDDWKNTNLLLGNNQYDVIEVARNGVELNYYLNDKKIYTGNYSMLNEDGFGLICQKGNQSVVLGWINTTQR